MLATLFLRPDERFHVRELERLTGVSAGSLHRELEAMAESGLLMREKARNQVFYQANSECPMYKVFVTADELAKLVNLVNL